jgi:hypothetical protein
MLENLAIYIRCEQCSKVWRIGNFFVRDVAGFEQFLDCGALATLAHHLQE